MARFDDSVIRNDRDTFRELWTADAVWEISPLVPMRAIGPTAIVAALDNFHKFNKCFFPSTGRPAIRLEQDRSKFRFPHWKPTKLWAQLWSRFKRESTVSGKALSFLTSLLAIKTELCTNSQ